MLDESQKHLITLRKKDCVPLHNMTGNGNIVLPLFNILDPTSGQIDQ